MKKNGRNIFLIDGNALCYRAFYAIKELSTSRGMPTNAIYGTINLLRKIIREYNPEMMAVVFDSKGPTDRHKKYKEYKIHRKPMPDDLVSQMEGIKRIIEAYNIPLCQIQGIEADDIIATLAVAAKKRGLKVTIVTMDKDALQLVDSDISVLSMSTAGDKTFDPEGVREKFGVDPDSMVDFMAILGDTSDNIPGVKGVGKVTAEKLINEFGTVDGIYRNLDKVVSESLRKKLVQGHEQALLSRELVLLNREVPIDIDLDSTQMEDPDKERLADLFREFEFEKLLKEVVPSKGRKVAFSEVCNEKDLVSLERKIKKAGRLAYSISKTENEDEVAVLAVTSGKSENFLIDIGGLKKRKVSISCIEDVFRDESIVKIGFDIKDNINLMKDAGLGPEGRFFDVMIAEYLMDPERPKYDLDGMAAKYTGHGLSEAGQVDWGADGQGQLDLSGENDSAALCSESEAVYEIFPVLTDELKKAGLCSLFDEVEMPLIPVLADMEDAGVGIDAKYLRERSGEMDGELAKLTDKIHRIAGEKFNVNSPKQLQVILYEKLGLPALKKTKTGISTDESVLIRLSGMHELPKILIEYRELNKLKTAYYDSILNMTSGDRCRIHARFNQAVTSTGRLSSSEPNLQNIPIKTKLGREIRKAFIPMPASKVLLAADYSQIELRILAHLSGDSSLVKAFSDGEDVHRYTASQIFGCDPEDVSDAKRSIAKTVNFGIIYGMSPFRLAKDLEISIDEARDFISAYFDRYTGVKDFIDDTISRAQKEGEVKTLLNRKRSIPEINSRNEHIRGFAERVAINTPIQGTAADIIKLSMIECGREFSGTDVVMTIQVHDELVFEIPENKVEDTALMVKKIMEGVIDLEVPLMVDLETGRNWYEMEELDISSREE